MHVNPSLSNPKVDAASIPQNDNLTGAQMAVNLEVLEECPLCFWESDVEPRPTRSECPDLGDRHATGGPWAQE